MKYLDWFAIYCAAGMAGAGGLLAVLASTVIVRTSWVLAWAAIIATVFALILGQHLYFYSIPNLIKSGLIEFAILAGCALVTRYFVLGGSSPKPPTPNVDIDAAQASTQEKYVEPWKKAA